MKTNFIETLKNPIGLSAGFDKDFNKSPSYYAKQGFGWVEYGSITADPHPGNDIQSFYPDIEREFIMNSMGLPNKGSKHLPSWKKRPIPTGLSIAFSPTTTTPCQDFETCINNTKGYFDYYTINASCPNVIRSDKCIDNIELIGKLCKLSKQFDYPIFLKLPALFVPDDRLAVAELTIKHNIAGIIVSNTMGWQHGSLSGKPLFYHSNFLLTEMKKIVKDKIPLIGCGGILSVDDAKYKMELGATALQLYTGYYFYGKRLITKLKQGVAK